MKSVIKRFSSALLSVLMVCSIFTAMPLSVSSATIDEPGLVGANVADTNSVSAAPTIIYYQEGDSWYGNPTSGYTYWRGNEQQSNVWIHYKDNFWYYIKSDGIMATGWVLIDNKYYYFNPQEDGANPMGSMKTGWFRYNNEWYYLYPDSVENHAIGEMATGWAKDPSDNNNYYYFYPNADESQNVDYYGYTHPQGAMAVSWILSAGDKRWYYLYESTAGDHKMGSVAKGLQTIKSKDTNTYTYLLDYDIGYMVEGWYNHDGAWYYSDSYGIAQKYYTINGDTYEFDDNFKLIKVNGNPCTTPMTALPDDKKTVSNGSIRFQLFNYSKDINFNEDGSIRMPTYISSNINNTDQSVFAFKDSYNIYPNLFPTDEFRNYGKYATLSNELEFDDFWLKRNHATVERKLVNNYPVLDLTRRADGTTKTFSGDLSKYNLSLDYLFGGREDHAVTKYEPVNSILQYNPTNKEYYYDSAQSAVDYNTETNEFFVRGYNDYIAYNDVSHFLPFNHTDGVKLAGSNNGKLQYEETDYWFGMRMDVDFAQPADGKINNEDMVFKFRGDDDVWIFIDGVLVLDLGGIHGASYGQINFNTGEVVTSSQINDLVQNYTTTILDAFKAAGVSTSDFNGVKFKDDSMHTLNMFYMERGANSSSCKIDFNLYIPRAQMDIKRAEYDYKEPYKDDFDFSAGNITKKADSNEICTYQIARKDGKALTTEEKEFKINNGAEQILGNDNRFTLKPGDTASFPNLILSAEYIVTEITSNSSNVKLKENSTYFNNSSAFEVKAEGTTVEVNHFNADPSKITIYFKKPSSDWGEDAYTYFMNNNNQQAGSEWPGKKMDAETGDKDGYYSTQIKVSDLEIIKKIIFNDNGGHQYPENKQEGVPVSVENDGQYFDLSDKKWHPFVKVTSEDDLVTKATATSTGSDNVLNTYVKDDDTVKLVINVPDGKRVVGVEAIGATVTKDSDGDWSFIMPKNDVIITKVVLEDIPKYTITASSAQPALGSATANGSAFATVEENNTVTLVATDNDNGFIGWSLTGNYEIIEGNLNSKVLKIIPTSDVDAVASFAAPTYTLIYKYKNRFNEDRQYVVKVSLSDDCYNEETKTWVVPDELIQNNAPAIDDLHKNCIWAISESQTEGTVVTLQGKQTETTYTVNFTKYSDNGSFEEDSISKLLYNSLVVDENNNYLITTAQSYTDGSGNKKTFSYWSVTLTDTGEEVVRAYSSKFMLRVTNNYNIIPVYDAVSSAPFIGAATYSREKFTDADGSNVQDYVYADFLVSYSSPNGILLNKTDSSEYKTGVVVETARYAQLSAEEQKAIKNEIAAGNNVAVPTQEYGSDTDAIINYIKDGSSNKYTYTGENKITSDHSGNIVTADSRSLSNYEITDNSVYSNKNVVDRGIRYKTNSAYPTYIMKAYYYVMHTSDSGETIVELSAPVYFNLYVAANMNPDFC